MTGPRQSSLAFLKSRLKSRPWACGLLVVAVCAGAERGRAQRSQVSSWNNAVAARRAFEAEPWREHTRAEFAQVMNNFRAIYHADPADPQAARAAYQVAELLGEQGRELNDPKSLRAAAGQYEFVAGAYPGSSVAVPALRAALALLGPASLNDPAEAARVRRQLRATSTEATSTGAAGTGETSSAAPTAKPMDVAASPSTERSSSTSNDPAPAVVTGIRHWSTASYTRVVIDLGGEVQFKAARVEHPDRIFFDLHGAKLAAGLAGKSFTITDDGYLKTIQAGQAGPDVARVVLAVQPVAEYTAFLLPNPYRLIIDIHGRQSPDAQTQTQIQGEAPGRSGQPRGAAPATAEAAPAPVVRQAAPPTLAANEAAASSTLPPMPVTDGSASFGLPAKRIAPLTSPATVARPRVVVSAKPTAAKPVPNSVSSAVPEGSREVASVSEGPGVIAASAQPSSKPVVERAAKTPVRSARPAYSTDAVGAAPTAPPPPTADGQSTLMRALGLKIGRIVIDAGHGGHDSGTLGPGGIEEKDVVLDVALRLGKLLHDKLGAEVVYTRADDTFVPLETRTAIANKAQADLFVSVHANSSQDPEARGVEVYYLNFTSDPEAMQVASRENAVSSQRVNQLSDLVKKIALKDKIDESRELAADVDQSLYSGLRKGNSGLKDRGVKKAPFVVLIGANMPSILAEISFVTNPTDAEKLEEPEYRQRVAQSLYDGIARYAAEINGGRPKARSTERAER